MKSTIKFMIAMVIGMMIIVIVKPRPNGTWITAIQM
jgi:hypothetical protein